MNYYLLPNVNTIEHHKLININFSNMHPQNIINSTLSMYLNTVKQQINDYIIKWDIYKKYTNPYEYIHSNIPNTKQSVCKYKPLSRSFFKMFEICKIHDILNNLPDNCKTFHLAEGPGGFIEAIVYLRDNKNDLYYGMTLQDENPNVPGWKKSNNFLKQHPNVILENGIDNTGNLFNKENLIYCYEKYKNSMDLITADGGFDFSIDFNNQETISSKLIYSQICFSTAIQKVGGTLILKVFDLFTNISIELLFLLSTMYRKVYISKPCASRIANSEKYIICQDFLLDDVSEIMKKFIESYENIKENNYLSNILNIEIPYFFIVKLEDINAIFGQQQIENISATINLIENTKQEKLEIIKKNNINKCISWCQKYGLLHNKNIPSSNIFLNTNTNINTNLKIDSVIDVNSNNNE